MTGGIGDLSVAVVGAGGAGLSVAWNLLELGCRKVTLLEQFEVGTKRGSSHGRSRITRNTYPHPAYVELMRRARSVEWPRLEAAAGEKLIHPTDGCFFGISGGLFDEFVRTMRSAPEATFLAGEEAARRFPQFRLGEMDAVIHDRSAGVIAASRTLSALARLCRERGAALREGVRVTAIERSGDTRVVRTDDGLFEADVVVVAAGSWSAGLLPFLAPRLTVIRQTVGYYALQGLPRSVSPQEFPVWAYIGRDANDFYYGLPDYGGEGIKAARHVTSGPADDPEVPADPEPRLLADLDRFVRDLFTLPVTGRYAAETCLYTNTATEDFLIDVSPEDPRVYFLAGFSGHGFKLLPVMGRAVAEMVVFGEPRIEEFVRHRERFTLDGTRG